MVRATVKEASALRRKPHVPDHDRTGARDEFARWFEQEFVDGYRDWQNWTLTEIAEDFGRSRQFVAETIDAYFEPADADPENDFPQFLTRQLERDSDGYEAGYRDGYWDGIADALNHQDELREWLGE